MSSVACHTDQERKAVEYIRAILKYEKAPPLVKSSQHVDVVVLMARTYEETTGGIVPWGRIVKVAGQLLKLYTREQVVEGWKLYCATTEIRFLSPEHFAAKAGVWCCERTCPAVLSNAAAFESRISSPANRP